MAIDWDRAEANARKKDKERKSSVNRTTTTKPSSIDWDRAETVAREKDSRRKTDTEHHTSINASVGSSEQTSIFKKTWDNSVGARQRKEAEQVAQRRANAPAESKMTFAALASYYTGMEKFKEMPGVGDALSDGSQKHMNNRINEQILENAKKDSDQMSVFERLESFAGDENAAKEYTDAQQKRRKQIKGEYYYLNDDVMADLRIVADGLNAEPMTKGLTGVQVAMFGGEEYGNYMQRIADAEKARKRLEDKGYSSLQVDTWAKMQQEDINQQYAADLQQGFDEMAKEHPVLSSFASVGIKFATTPLDAATKIDEATSGNINTNGIVDISSQTDDMIRSSVAKDIEEESEIGAWLYNVGMSGVDSAVASVMPGGALFLATDAATGTMRDLTNRGLSAEEAFFGGVAAGVFEGLFEKVSIGNFKALQEVSPLGVKDVVKNVLKSTGVNFTEEAATELANIVYDTIAHGDLSQLNMLAEKYDGDYAKAFGELALQVGEAGLSGAVMGSGFGVTGSAIGYASNYGDIKTTGKQVKAEGIADLVLEQGKTAPEKSRPNQAYQNAQKKLDKGKSLSDRDIGIVAYENRQYAIDNAPNLKGAFESAKTLDDVEAIYNTERYKIENSPSIPKEAKSKIKALDADYKTAKKTLEQFNKSGARAMFDDSLRGKTYTETDLVKTKMPTIGKTEAGEIVSVSSIENIEDGNITVKTSEGTTQELNIRKDIKSVDAQTLWTNAAQNFPDAESAQAFIDNYDGGSIADYTKAFKDYYHLAATGMTLSQINEHEIAPYYDLSNKAQAAAVELGQKSISYQQGVVDLTARPKTKAQQLQVNMLDSIGKHIGMNVVVVDTMSKHDGFYRSGTNQIVIALDSSSGAILRTAGHETYHFVKEEMSDRAKDIETFVLDTLKKNKGEKWINDRLSFYEKQGYKTKEAQVDELVADSLFDAFTSKRAVKDFATENQSLAKKLVNHIQKLLSDIKNIINKLVASGKYDEIKAWQDDIDSLDKLNNMFLDVLDELAAKKADNPIKTKNTAEAVKSTKHNVITKSDVNAAQSIGRKSINSLSPTELNSLSAFAKKYWNELGAKSPFFRAWFGDWREGDITPVAVADKKGKTSSTAHNADTGWEINIPGKAKNETTRHKSNKAKFALPYLDYLEDIAKNAVLLESFGSDKGGDSLLMHSFYTVADIGNGTEVLKLYVEELNNVNSDNTTKRTYMLQNITKQSGSPGSQNNSVSRVTPTAIKTVADLFTFVKQNDKNFTPNPASKIVNPDGTPKVMYHGTQSSFTAFDKKKAKSYGYYGKGFYFTDSESHAGQYGNAMAVYLDVKNPLEPGKNKLTKNQLRTFLEAVAENEDYDIWNYGTEDISEIIGSIYKDDTFAVLQDVNATAIGDLAEAISLFNSVNGTSYDGVITPTETVVYEPTQIKSAKDNIGTFDGSNEDIRYSSKRTVASGKKKSYNKSSYYNEFDSLAMSWRYKANTKVGDVNIVSSKGSFVLLEATEDGYVELARGNWSRVKELKAEYERAHKETNESLHNYSEELRFDGRTDTWDLFDDEDRGYGVGNSSDFGRQGLQSDSSGSDEHSKLGDKEESLKSTKRELSVSEEASNYILDTKEYQEIMKLVDERFKLTNSVKLDEKAVDRLAGRILKKSNSNFSREQLTSQLTALFDFIANSREVTWEEVTGIAASIAKDVLTESQTLDRSMQQEYADVLKLMRESRVYISPEVRAEINHNFGSLEAFRKRLGSKLKITVTDESAVPLDVFWRELAENRPEMFEEDTNYLDMPSKLVDFFEMTSPQYINPYNIEMDMDEAAYDLALQIYDEYFNIPEVQSEAKKHAREMEALRGKYNAKIKEIHNTYRERIKRIRNEHLEKMNELRKTDRERYEKLRTEKNRKIQETKELYRQRHENYRSKRNETQLKQKLRAQIYRTAKGLTDKLVNPTDQKHVPQELIASVNEFCKAITDSGVFALDKTLKLQDAFRRISENSKDPDANLSTMYNEEIGEMLEDLRNIIGGRKLTELNSAELARVKEATQYFAHIVSMSNKAFSENIKEKLSDLQTEALDELSKLNPDRKRIKFEMQKGLLKPVTFFELLDSPTLMKLYQNIRDGEGRWYNIVAAAKEYRQETAAEHGYKSWKNEKITLSPERFDGEIVLSVDEALSIYATAKREQGVEHLLLGGVVREEDAKKKLKRKDRSKSVDVRSENTPLTAKDISGISEMLTKEQKAYADSLIKYLSNDMAALGNEVSMKLFGIRKYNEKNYFPIKSASNFLYSKPAVENDARIKHMSMTKRTVPKANNPVIIGSFTETVMNHCNDMALYNAFCLSLEDFNRVYNYRTQPTTFEKPTSIKQKIDRAFGAKANGYIEQLLTDINGGVTQQAGAGFVNKMIAKAKKNAVFGSLSVAVQQPSAVARAFLYVDPKYFVASTFSKKDWNELKKYAPVAGVKEMGYFDTNVGKQAVDWMSEDGYDGLKEKAFALFKDKYYRDDKLSFLPSYMDRITWGHIWNAVKKETAHNNPDMDRNSDEFLKLAGKRFTYVIDRTQVYDSVFARSEWMRSKDTGVKVATAFMSEPLTNYNMLYSAAVRVRHGDVKFGAKAVSAYIVSVAFNSVLKSIVTAARDDDEDKSYWEKYLSNLVDNFVDDSLGMIPYIKDFVSLLQGYDSSRMDTQALADIADAAMIMFDDNKTGWEKFKSSFGAVGIVAGIPIKNLIRDGEVIYNAVDKIFKGEFEPTTKKGITYAIKSELGFDVPKKYEQLIDAYLEGDDAHYNKVNNNLKAEKSESAISEGIKKAVKNKYQAGTITEEQATNVLQELLGYDDEKAYWAIDEWSSDDEDCAKYNDFENAVRTGKNLNNTLDEYLDHGVAKKTLAGQITKAFKAEYIELYRKDKAEASALRRRLLDAYVALGYDRDDKADDIANWLED